MKSIKIDNKNYCKSSIFDYNSCSIIDKFVLQDSDFITDDEHFIFPQYLIDASKLAESETCCKPFYKLLSLFLSHKSYIEAMSILKDIKNIGMHINFFHISASNKEELEDLTNPDYLNKGISSLNISLNDPIILTNTFFENVNRLSLKYIYFELNYEDAGSFDIIRILKNIPQNIQLNLTQKISFNSCSLCFKNVPIKIVQSNCKDPLFVKWNEFTFFLWNQSALWKMLV